MILDPTGGTPAALTGVASGNLSWPERYVVASSLTHQNFIASVQDDYVSVEAVEITPRREKYIFSISYNGLHF